MTKNRASELQLIDYIRKRFPHKRGLVRVGIGDDAMVMQNNTVVSTDSFAESVHFDFKYFTKYSLGYRAMAASLSDLAAMAAKPVCALVSLYLPKRTTLDEIADLYDGFRAVVRDFRLGISGGDIIESPFWGVTITVIGITKKPLLRSGARPGQVLLATNFLGLAEVGRLVLLHRLNKREFPKAVEKHLYPQARISESLKLKRFATACIDISDGLSTDAFHISEESRVKVVIEPDILPVHPEVALFCHRKKIDPVKFILSAGEDFELLFTADAKPSNTGFPVNRVGRIEKGRGLFIQTSRGLRSLKPSGYEHLI
jgi:thiamine-monophosphate kinase